MASATPPPTDGGYKPGFLKGNSSIGFPAMTAVQKKDSKPRLDYIHYSVIMSQARKLAYFTAVNIDGKNWQDNSRSGSFKNDPRINGDEQLGTALYSAKKSDFDKGHLVRREDPEWGDKATATKAGINTFYYTNAAPQHKDLNREIWADLEANILHTGAADQQLKCTVFTGPILSDKDGVFVTQVKGEDIKIPSMFWKVVVWKKSDGKTYAVGFLQNQEKFLLRDGIIRKQVTVSLSTTRTLRDEDIFEHLKFKDGKSYQVKIDEIEKMTGLKFNWKGVARPYKKTTPTAIKGRKIAPSAVKKSVTMALANPGTIGKVRKMALTGLMLG
jgi:endonuclease G, mitochondrial